MGVTRPNSRVSGGFRRRGVVGVAGAVVALAATLLAVTSGACDGGGCPALDAPEPSASHVVLLDPSAEAFQQLPPPVYQVELETTQGVVLIEVESAWAPLGAYRFYNLVRNGFFDGTAFYRVIPGFMAQFGVHPVPAVQAVWNDETFPDERVTQSNVRGMVTFAKAGEDTRTTQLFINYGNNARLDALGFAPIGRVVRGMGVADRLYSGYGETAPTGQGPDFGCMLEGGGAYLDRRFPRLDHIRTARVVAVEADTTG
jgi:peptidyl-prolyl cis-trans isomerase A (cyclophilin A)